MSVFAMRDLDQINSEIASLELKLSKANARKLEIEAVIAAIDADRPAGIPNNWVAAYTTNGNSNNVTVHGWYDPNKIGPDFILLSS